MVTAVFPDVVTFNRNRKKRKKRDFFIVSMGSLVQMLCCWTIVSGVL